MLLYKGLFLYVQLILLANLTFFLVIMGKVLKLPFFVVHVYTFSLKHSMFLKTKLYINVFFLYSITNSSDLNTRTYIP
jgi:hypothetical protein